ncbi:MAG: hypothetical protein AVDCRST_MAG08-1736, partial [uncultured Acetobacteraceae bacterium]
GVRAFGPERSPAGDRRRFGRHPGAAGGRRLGADGGLHAADPPPRPHRARRSRSAARAALGGEGGGVRRGRGL